MKRRTPSSTLLIAFLASFIVATYSFLLFSSPYLIFTNASQYEDTLKAVYSVANNNTFLYGTISAIDATSSAIYVDVTDRFDPGNPPKRLRVAVESPAYIAAQELISEGGAATAISDATVTDLSHVSLGSHAAISVSRRTDGSLVTHYILFGDPL